MLKLVFTYPNDPIKNLEITTTTRAYQDIWEQDGERIVQSFKTQTGLDFAQDEIEVISHNEMSFSGMKDRPMRLSVWNKTLNKRRIALIHELGHRLLFGHALYVDVETDINNDEVSVYLFQGDVLKELYGQEIYDEWVASADESLDDQHSTGLRYVLNMTEDQRRAQLRTLKDKRLV